MGQDENYKIKLGSIKFGASLQSLVNQANRLGYDYVYSESRGSDAFFIRKDINPFPSLTSKEGWVELFWHKKLWLNKLKGITKEYEDRNLQNPSIFITYIKNNTWNYQHNNNKEWISYQMMINLN